MLNLIGHIQWNTVTYSILIFGFISLLFSLIKTKNIIHYALKTDNELITNTASQMKMFDLPSRSHCTDNSKSSMKEVSVWLLTFFVRLFPTRNTHSDRPLVALCFTAHFLNSLLMYLIGSFFFGPACGCLSLILYYSIYNNKLICLWGGVVQISQFFSLLSIYMLTVAHKHENQIHLYMLSGFFMAASLFSSASSRKYMIFNLAALVFFQFNYFSFNKENFYNKILLFSIALLIMFLAYHFISFLILKIKLVEKLEENEKINYFSKKLELKNFYEKIIKHKKKLIIFFSFSLLCMFLISIFFQNINVIINLMSFLFGFLLLCFLVSYPKFYLVSSRYYTYSRYGKDSWKSRFYDNLSFIRSKGFNIDSNYRGAGVKWILLYFFKASPHYVLLFVFSIVYTLIYKINFIVFILTILIALSPILIGEITKGIQIARSTYPAFIGLNFFIVTTSFYVERSNQTLFISIFILSLTGVFINSFRYYFDILPSRLFLNSLYDFLKGNNIKKLITLDSFYSFSSIDCLLKAYQDDFNISLVKDFNRLDDNELILLIPTNNKSVLCSDFPESRTSSIGVGLDDSVNYILNKYNLNSSCLKSFKTICSSKYWIDESEVTTFRYFFLKDISYKDYERGLLRIVDSNYVNKILKEKF